MVDEGWTTVEKKGPREAGAKAGGVRQERPANGGGPRGLGATPVHRDTTHCSSRACVLLFLAPLNPKLQNL